MSLPTWADHPPPGGRASGPPPWNVPASGLHLLCFLAAPTIRYLHRREGRSAACLGESCPRCAAGEAQEWRAYAPAERRDVLPPEPQTGPYDGPWEEKILPTGRVCRFRAAAPSAGPREVWTPVTCCLTPQAYWSLREYLLSGAGPQVDEYTPDCHLPWRGLLAQLSRPGQEREGRVLAQAQRQRRDPESLRDPWPIDPILDRIWGRQPRVLPLAEPAPAPPPEDDSDRPATLPFRRAAAGGAS